MFLNLRNKLVEDMAGFQEVAIVENNNINEEIKDEVKSNEGKKAVEEKDYEAVTQEVYSNTYMNSDNLEFIKSILDGAKSSYNKYGILPSITMAQAILESGWGSSELAVAHNNLFGIKADSRWDGAVATPGRDSGYCRAHGSGAHGADDESDWGIRSPHLGRGSDRGKAGGNEICPGCCPLRRGLRV